MIINKLSILGISQSKMLITNSTSSYIIAQDTITGEIMWQKELGYIK